MPMVFPSTRHDASRKMPSSLFPEMTLVDPATDPPIVAPDAMTSTPLKLLGRAAVPAAVVPMSFPSTRHDAPTRIPLALFPEMTLADPGVVPPIVAPDTSTSIPSEPIGTAAVPAPFVPM